MSLPTREATNYADCIECNAASPAEVLDGNGVCAECIAKWACKPCGKPIAWPQDECHECEREAEWERNRGPQTLADVGMSESDFR